MAYPAGFKYTKDHEWIDLAGDRGKVGITDYAQQQLGDVVYVELPEIGAKLKQGQSFGTIESVKAVSELYSPVTGEVVEVNSAPGQTRDGEQGSARQLDDRHQAGESGEAAAPRLTRWGSGEIA
jgi:glycine cleavage system H protein